jgi:hypothetical protein
MDVVRAISFPKPSDNERLLAVVVRTQAEWEPEALSSLRRLLS